MRGRSRDRKRQSEGGVHLGEGAGRAGVEWSRVRLWETGWSEGGAWGIAGIEHCPQK